MATRTASHFPPDWCRLMGMDTTAQIDPSRWQRFRAWLRDFVDAVAG